MEIKITENAVKVAIGLDFNHVNTKEMIEQILNANMWAAIRARHPECVNGEWQIDINTMTVKGIDGYKEQILKDAGHPYALST